MLLTSNKQELFNLALTGMREQYAPAIDHDSNECVYLDTETGNKCGVGHCMTDEALARTISSDGHPAIGGIDEIADTLAARGIDVDDVVSTKEILTFLEMLQTTHDHANRDARDLIDDYTSHAFNTLFMCNFEAKAYKFAIDWSLLWTAPAE